MRKRIESKIYDTDKSVYIGETADGKKLYQKKGRSREFFAVSGISKIVDVSPEQVREYTQGMEVVNEPVYAPSRSHVMITVDVETHAKLKIIAARTGMSISGLIHDFAENLDEF